MNKKLACYHRKIFLSLSDGNFSYRSEGDRLLVLTALQRGMRIAAGMGAATCVNSRPLIG